MYKTICRGCGGSNLKLVISLGDSPLANNLLESINDEDEMFPLEMMYCIDCHNCQLSYVVPPEKMFNHYLYVSSTTKTFREHFKNASNQYIKDYNLGSSSFIIDIGSNDGIALKNFKENNIKVLGIEPAKNIVDIALKNGIETIHSYFTKEIAESIVLKYGKADIITASNVFAHSDELEEIAHSAFSILKEDGTFIIEVQYLLDTIKDLTFDNIYHEHVNYWSVTSLNNFFNRLGYSIIKVEHINTHGGSIRIFIKNKSNVVDESVNLFLFNEKIFGLKNYNRYILFANEIKKLKINIKDNIKKYKHKNKKIVAYGAPAKATTSLNYYDLTTRDIDYVVEDNVLKHNKVIPGVKIPIYSKDKIIENKPDIVIVMAWNFLEEIKRNNQQLIDIDIKFISIKDLQDQNYFKNEQID
jgi:SAM-dependent methyltransferase